MCNAPEGKYVKSGYDFLFKEHTYFWDKNLCIYRLGSEMNDSEYALFHADPNYSSLFADGGTSSAFEVGINNGNNPAKGGDSYDWSSLLVPSEPQSKKKNALKIILIVAGIAVAAFIIYKFLNKK